MCTDAPTGLEDATHCAFPHGGLVDRVKSATQSRYLMLLILLSKECMLKSQWALQGQLVSSACHNLAKMISRSQT